MKPGIENIYFIFIYYFIIIQGDVSSARRGCYAKEKVYPVNYGLKSGSGSASGFFPSH